MTYVLDTHPIVWFLENNPRLSERAAAILSDPTSELVVPSIVLAEIWYLFERRRIKTSPTQLRTTILTAANFSLYPLDEAVIDLLPSGLEMHDAIIVATGIVYRDVIKRPTELVTCDVQITKSKLIDIHW